MKRKLLIGVVAVLVASQLVTCERTNPPVTGDLNASPEVAAILRRSCYDCHSNETTWPWYSRVAPISWLVHRDVTEGRRHLNFSEWDRVPAEKRARKISGAGRMAKQGEMPPWFYLPAHWNARLGDSERAALERWANDQH